MKMTYVGQFRSGLLRFAPLAMLLCSVLTLTGCVTFAAEAGPTVPDDAPEFSKTQSGLKYRVLRKGDGTKPAKTDTVTVHYKGWLDNGNEFDSSYKRGQPTTFPLNGVIAGWTEGMQLVSKGGLIELEIPSELGYGARGAGGVIPANATLHFLVELIEIK